MTVHIYIYLMGKKVMSSVYSYDVNNTKYAR